ncbi:AAR2 protein family [Wolffia australiana]
MDQETAMELVAKGATLLVLDVPPFTLFGIDTQMFSVGPLFKGIKMIPPGPHIVYYCASNRDGTDFSPVISFFIYTSISEVVILKWQQQEENLVKLSEEEEGRYSQAVKNLAFDRNLGPYALEHFGQWKQISDYVSKDTIKRLEPIGGEISIMYEQNLVDTVHITSGERKLAEQLEAIRFSKASGSSPTRGCFYTHIPALVKHKGATREELTMLNLDKTQVLENILTKKFGGQEDLLLGEFQFAFIAFMMGQSLQAFYQWKSLVILMFNCTEAPFHVRTRLFSKFVKALYYQLNHGFRNNNREDAGRGVSLSLDDAWVSKEGFLHHHCQNFFLLIEQAGEVDGNLLSWTRRLKELLQRELGWSFNGDETAEEDEYSPVIVLPEESPRP